MDRKDQTCLGNSFCCLLPDDTSSKRCNVVLSIDNILHHIIIEGQNRARRQYNKVFSLVKIKINTVPFTVKIIMISYLVGGEEGFETTIIFMP
jgi:hypothetical protein